MAAIVTGVASSTCTNSRAPLRVIRRAFRGIRKRAKKQRRAFLKDPCSTPRNARTPPEMQWFKGVLQRPRSGCKCWCDADRGRGYAGAGPRHTTRVRRALPAPGLGCKKGCALNFFRIPDSFLRQCESRALDALIDDDNFKSIEISTSTIVVSVKIQCTL